MKNSAARWRDVQNVSVNFENCELRIILRKLGAGDEARTRNSSAWEAEFSILYFPYLQNRSERMCVHAQHTVHVLPDLRVAVGHLGGTAVRTANMARAHSLKLRQGQTRDLR